VTALNLPEVLRLHRLWLNGEAGGIRAYLTGANLAGASLVDADLTRADLARADLARASLSGASLAGAYLAGAYLADANLAGANLAGAKLARANMARATGIKWACIAPVGQGRRMVSAWSHESLSEPVIAGGCFQGTFTEFRSTIAGVPWGWGDGSEEDQARWRAECSAAADLLELAVES
jgi:uncharacterized protein YjbI with pentapeptide repeats